MQRNSTVHLRSLASQVRHCQLSQTAHARRPRSPPEALSEYHAALRRTNLVHRQSAKWRSSPSYSTTPTDDHSTSSPAAAARAVASESRARLLLSYHDLEHALERRGLKSFRVLLAVAALLATGAALAWPRIKQWGAVEGAEVAAASLETEQLQEKASAMVHEVLADPKTGLQVEALLKKSMSGLMRDDDFTAWAVEWTSKVLAEALTWDEVVQKGTGYVAAVLNDEESKRAAEKYMAEAVQSVVGDDAVQDTVAKVRSGRLMRFSES